MEYEDEYDKIRYNTKTLKGGMEVNVLSVKNSISLLQKRLKIAFVVIGVILGSLLILELANAFLFTFGNRQIIHSENVGQSNNCDEGWIDGGPADLGCLHFSPENLIRAAALDYCANRRSTLLEIHSEKQMKFLRTFLDSVEVFGTQQC